MARERSLITIEESLSGRLFRRWNERGGRDSVDALVSAVRDDDFGAAHEVCAKLAFTAPLEDQEPAVETLGTAAFLLGANFVAGSVGATKVARGDADLPFEVAHAGRTLLRTLDQVVGEEVRRSTTNLLIEIELLRDEERAVEFTTKDEVHARALVQKVGGIQNITNVPPGGLGAFLNSSVRGNIKRSFDLGANLTTSRLVSFGYLSEAVDRGQTTYQRSEVLDSVICPVCRRLHGRVFSVAPAHDIIRSQLLESDPKKLKGSFPFPASSRAGVKELTSLSRAELEERGWSVPPSHPHCRGILQPVGTVPESQIIPFRPLPNSAGIKPTVRGRPAGQKPAVVPEDPPKPKTPKDTEQKFRNANGTWDKERVADVHRPILNETFLGTEGVAAAERPVFQMTGGGSASGKGTILKRPDLLKLDRRMVTIDPDEIKTRIPEFIKRKLANDPTAAAFVHEESSYLSKEAMKIARESRRPYLLDGTGDGDIGGLKKKVLPAREAGFEVRADYVYVNTDEAVRRSTSRAIRTGREVPVEDILRTHKNVSNVVGKALDEDIFDEFTLWNNNAAEFGDVPIAVKKRGKPLKINDQEAWDDFIAKGRDNRSADDFDLPGIRKRILEDKPDLIDTETRFRTGPDGQWDRERVQKVHKPAMSETFEGSAPVGAREKPVFQMTGGGSASGKGTILKGDLLKIDKRSVLIDPDELKTLLPEFQQLKAAGNTRAAAIAHEESSYLAKEAMRIARTERRPYLLDGTGDGGFDGLKKKVLPAQEAGFTVKADYVYVNTEEAVRRSTSRALRTGREVPVEDILRTHKNVSLVVEKAIDDDLFDAFRLWNNNGKELNPVPIAEKLKGKPLKINDQQAWDDFLGKARDKRTADNFDLDAIKAELQKPKIVRAVDEIVPEERFGKDFEKAPKGVKADFETRLAGDAAAIDAVDDYTTQLSFFEMQTALRANTLDDLPANLRASVTTLDKVLAENRIGADLSLWRGVRGERFDRFNNFGVGTEFSDSGFGSWTSDRLTAVGFTNPTDTTPERGVLFRLLGKKDTKGLFVGGGESEFILPRGKRYRIVDVEEDIVTTKGGREGTVTQKVITVVETD